LASPRLPAFQPKAVSPAFPRSEPEQRQELGSTALPGPARLPLSRELGIRVSAQLLEQAWLPVSPPQAQARPEQVPGRESPRSISEPPPASPPERERALEQGSQQTVFQEPE
jgi:hypothetical protein